MQSLTYSKALAGPQIHQFIKTVTCILVKFLTISWMSFKLKQGLISSNIQNLLDMRNLKASDENRNY